MPNATAEQGKLAPDFELATDGGGTVRLSALRGRKVVGRVAFSLLLLGAIAVGGVAGLLFVDSSDLPQIRALEDFQPDVVTELYADDGQVIGNFALQRLALRTRGWFAVRPSGPLGRNAHWVLRFFRCSAQQAVDPTMSIRPVDDRMQHTRRRAAQRLGHRLQDCGMGWEFEDDNHTRVVRVKSVLTQADHHE